MFQAFASIDRTARFSARPAAVEPTEAPANYMIYRDGRPFLMVNAASRHVRSLIEGFSVQSDFCWTYQLQEAA